MGNADRSEIEILRKRRYSMRDIARVLKRPVSGIWYELRKKRKKKRYDAAYAKHLSYVRMRKQRKVGKKIALDPLLRSFVENNLLDDQSPDAIAGRLRSIEHGIQYVSPAAIKRYVKSVYGRRIESHRAKIFKRRHRGTRKKGVLDGRRLISKRPKQINERKGIGNVEGDFIVSGKSGKGLGFVLIDRNLRKALLEKILPVSVRNVERALVRMKKRFPEIKTITFDNDILFLEHKRLERILGIRIYFCHPRSPWEKPSVENFNKWLRRYIPKSSDISRYSLHLFKQLEAKANRRFMDVLGFRTPDEMYARTIKRKKRLKARSKRKQ
ncbi:MAG: IS30 family transposase [Minisyncoccia bacterium]